MMRTVFWEFKHQSYIVVFENSGSFISTVNLHKIIVRPPTAINSNKNGYSDPFGSVELKISLPMMLSPEPVYDPETEKAFREEYTPKMMFERVAA